MKRWGTVAILGSLLFSCTSPLLAGQFDHSPYDTVLRRYVDEDGGVDYPSIRLNSLTALESYFERLAEASPARWSKAERMAFWINAYNAHLLYLVAQRPGMKKMSEDPGLFDQSFMVAGQSLSLNDIEHRILRGTTNEKTRQGPIPDVSFTTVDPRIHFSLSPGTVSGPRLRNFAYTAENVLVTLQVNAAAFANSYKYVTVKNGQLRLSRLFQWYADDFKSVGGAQNYLISLLSPEKGGDAAAVKELLKTSYPRAVFVYDWSVNAQSMDPFRPPELPLTRDETTPTKLLLNSPRSK